RKILRTVASDNLCPIHLLLLEINVSRFVSTLLVAVFALVFLPSLHAADEPAFTRTQDVIYGRKFGTALTMDVFTPKKDANGAAVIFCASGGWVSAHETIDYGYYIGFYPELLKRGYTVFAVVHGSQPMFPIP